MVTGKARMRLLSEATDMASVIPLRKKASAFSLASVAIGRSHQLFGFRYGERGEQDRGKPIVRELAHPDVEEVGQVGIADVIVVRAGR